MKNTDDAEVPLKEEQGIDIIKKMMGGDNPNVILEESNLGDKKVFVIEKLKSGGFMVFVSNGIQNRFFVDSYDGIISLLKSYK